MDKENRIAYNYEEMDELIMEYFREKCGEDNEMVIVGTRELRDILNIKQDRSCISRRIKELVKSGKLELIKYQKKAVNGYRIVEGVK